MAQRIDHLYKLVTIPAVYEFFQDSIGAKRARARIANEIVQAEPGMKVLDVGCGPASMLRYFPGVDYTGIDLNEPHIAFARDAYAGRGRFLVGDVTKELSDEFGTYDRVCAFGLLHHLSDDECRNLLVTMRRMLKPGGLAVTIDPVRVPKQRMIPRLMIHYDSGLNIRDADGYAKLSYGTGMEAQCTVFHDLLRIPYDNIGMAMRPVA